MFKTFLQENQIIIPSYQHYGGLAGFQDYGIIGFQIKNELVNQWRKWFLGPNIREVEIPATMPYAALKASGHVDRFTDYVVYGNDRTCYRADHVAKKWFRDNGFEDLTEQVDSWNQQQLEEKINSYKMLGDNAPVGKIKVEKKNLMIEVPSNSFKIPSNGSDVETDFLRPELAQGIFLNFNLYQQFFKDGEYFMPFGIAQIGKSYRKEISPQPFTRLREFTQAEIEFFVDPMEKTHELYKNYENTVIPILTDEMQENGITTPLVTTISDAVEKKMISHKLMAYFLAKIYMFAKKIGLKDDKIRFRQHQKNEMAHYASQCWDLECLVGGSWLECVGCADRGCYDLTAHGKEEFMVKRKLNEPIKITFISIRPNAKKWTCSDKSYINLVKKYFETLDQKTLFDLKNNLETKGTIDFSIDEVTHFTQITKEMFIIDEKDVIMNYETFIPHVIEPSFGIDRLLYAVLDQNLWTRPEDERRVVMSLPNELCVYDIAVFPLHKKEEMTKMADAIRTHLVERGFKCYTDNSGTAIGKKYVRCDELGVKYAITVDPGSLNTGIVTIRNRDTMEQKTVHHSQVMFNLP